MASNDEWEPCPAGLLDSMVSQRLSEHRRRKFETIGAPLAVAAVLLIAAMAVMRMNGGEGRAAQITCQQAVQQFESYSRGELDGVARSSFETHLDHCPECREQFRAEYPSEAQLPNAPPAPALAAL